MPNCDENICKNKSENGTAVCKKCSDMLFDYVSDNLCERDKGFVKTHTDSCKSCQRELAIIKEIINVTGELNDVKLPNGLEERISISLKQTEKEIKGKNAAKRFKLSRVAGSVLPVAAAAVIAIGLYAGGVFDEFMRADDIFTETKPYVTVPESGYVDASNNIKENESQDIADEGETYPEKGLKADNNTAENKKNKKDTMKNDQVEIGGNVTKDEVSNTQPPINMESDKGQTPDPLSDGPATASAGRKRLTDGETDNSNVSAYSADDKDDCSGQELPVNIGDTDEVCTVYAPSYVLISASDLKVYGEFFNVLYDESISIDVPVTMWESIKELVQQTGDTLQATNFGDVPVSNTVTLNIKIEG